MKKIYALFLIAIVIEGCKKAPEMKAAPQTYYKITLTASGDGSLYSGNSNAVNTTTPLNVAQGDNVSITIDPNVGNGVLTLTVDGQSVPTIPGQSLYTFTNVQKDHSISATFEPMETITTATDGFGSVTFAPYSVLSGQTVTFTFTPKPGLITDSLFINGTFIKDLAGTATYKLDNVTKNQALRITFALTPRSADSLTNLLAGSWHYVQYDYQYTGTTTWITAPYLTDCEKARYEVYTAGHTYTYFLGGASCDPSYAPTYIYFNGAWKFDAEGKTILIAGNEYTNATIYQYVTGAYTIAKLTADSLVISYPVSGENFSYRFHYVHK